MKNTNQIYYDKIELAIDVVIIASSVGILYLAWTMRAFSLFGLMS